MDMTAPGANYNRMPSVRHSQYKKLHLGEWLARLNVKQADLARDVGASEPYLSNLISGKKHNPAVSLLLKVSDRLRIKLNDLYKSPPSSCAHGDLHSLSPPALPHPL